MIRKKYIWFLPSIPVYPNNERDALLVKKAINTRTLGDVEFFKLTDPSISYAFVNIVHESIEELNSLITQPHLKFIILSLKYSIKLARPKQITPE